MDEQADVGVLDEVESLFRGWVGGHDYDWAGAEVLRGGGEGVGGQVCVVH